MSSRGDSALASAMRLIDGDRVVVDQNHAMAELSGIEAESEEDISCVEQLRCSICGTEECALERLRDGTDEWLSETVDIELPDGERVRTSMVAERVTDEAGSFDGVIESFLEIPDPTADADERERLSAPEPSDPEAFRTALTTVLCRAVAEGVPVGGRSWECSDEQFEITWDVEISRVEQTER